jgi:hypothetical protein
LEVDVKLGLNILPGEERKTLRDEMAIAVAPSLLSKIWIVLGENGTTMDNVYEAAAIASYEVADAMLAARNVRTATGA